MASAKVAFWASIPTRTNVSLDDTGTASTYATALPAKGEDTEGTMKGS